MFPGETLESPTVKTLVSRNSAIFLPSKRWSISMSFLRHSLHLTAESHEKLQSFRPCNSHSSCKKGSFFFVFSPGRRVRHGVPMRLDGWMGTCIEFDCGPQVMPGEIINSGFFIYCPCNEGIPFLRIGLYRHLSLHAIRSPIMSLQHSFTT